VGGKGSKGRSWHFAPKKGGGKGDPYLLSVSQLVGGKGKGVGGGGGRGGGSSTTFSEGF